MRFLFAPSYIGGQLQGQFAAAGGRQSCASVGQISRTLKGVYHTSKIVAPARSRSVNHLFPAKDLKGRRLRQAPPRQATPGAGQPADGLRGRLPLLRPRRGTITREPVVTLPVYPADPCRRNGEAWAHRMPGHRFPYRVETLTGDGRTVLIVEGEKCADVAARVFNRI